MSTLTWSWYKAKPRSHQYRSLCEISTRRAPLSVPSVSMVCKVYHSTMSPWLISVEFLSIHKTISAYRCRPGRLRYLQPQSSVHVTAAARNYCNCGMHSPVHFTPAFPIEETSSRTGMNYSYMALMVSLYVRVTVKETGYYFAQLNSCLCSFTILKLKTALLSLICHTSLSILTRKLM